MNKSNSRLWGYSGWLAGAAVKVACLYTVECNAPSNLTPGSQQTRLTTRVHLQTSPQMHISWFAAFRYNACNSKSVSKHSVFCDV